MHDSCGHAEPLECFSEKMAKDHGVSAQDYFGACCNPDTLEKGNLFSMSRQIQAWFVQFCEAPSVMFQSLSTLPDMFLPRSVGLPRSWTYVWMLHLTFLSLRKMDGSMNR